MNSSEYDSAKTEKFFQDKQAHFQQFESLIGLFIIVGISLLLIMGVINHYNGDFEHTVTLFIFSGYLFLTYVAYKIFKNERVIVALLLLFAVFFGVYLVVTGGVSNNGHLWLFIYPPLLLYLAGSVRGMIALALFLLITLKKLAAIVFVKI